MERIDVRADTGQQGQWNVAQEGGDLTPRERALIRNEFMVRFGQAPSLASGILVKRWATGPNKGQPKPGTVIQGMLDRGLMELRDDGGHWLRARFTEAGFAALRLMAKDARVLPPGDYQHLIDELRTV
ncbi:hypothetical protein [Azospirillum griseum]|uniref:Uncharacterized protein n=1 Tax=Azospirillum griseum TaxID=2496639 RepID=A0A3S0HU78_9PROT|nr:hypothetical protein [Azospirillum griseum]RTR15667.1 hypothetical protein EJ903_22535 [Azospirillum griseum]